MWRMAVIYSFMLGRVMRHFGAAKRLIEEKSGEYGAFPEADVAGLGAVKIVSGRPYIEKGAALYKSPIAGMVVFSGQELSYKMCFAFLSGLGERQGYWVWRIDGVPPEPGEDVRWYEELKDLMWRHEAHVQAGHAVGDSPSFKQGTVKDTVVVQKGGDEIGLVPREFADFHRV